MFQKHWLHLWPFPLTVNLRTRVRVSQMYRLKESLWPGEKWLLFFFLFHNELNKFKSGSTLLALRPLSINRCEDKSFIIGFYARSSGGNRKWKIKRAIFLLLPGTKAVWGSWLRKTLFLCFMFHYDGLWYTRIFWWHLRVYGFYDVNNVFPL